jgi:diguanylate cyclase (GGDEF)-like protein
VGDTLLRYLGYHLARITRESDIVSRFAGDEFVLILPSTTLNDAHRLIERLESFFSKNPLKKNKAVIPVSLSFGAANILDPGVLDPPSLLKRADQMLYEAKRKKKNEERIVPLKREAKSIDS